MAGFIFKMAAVRYIGYGRHLGLLKVQSFNCGPGRRANMQYLDKLRADRSNH